MWVWLGQSSLLKETLRGQCPPSQLPAIASDNGFDGIDWLDRLLPSHRARDWAALGQTCGAAGLGPCGLNLNLCYGLPPARLERHLALLVDLLGQCHLLKVRVVRVALAEGGLSVNNLLQTVAGLRPKSSRRTDPLGRMGRAAYRTLHRAGFIGGQRGRISPPPRATPERLQAAARALKRLAKPAEDLSLTLGLENHWGVTSHPVDLLAILELVNSDHLGVCLDLGNFYKEQDALAAIAALAPSAVQIHYKARALDPEDDVPTFGYEANLGLLKDLGYGGAFSIEYEGPGPGLEAAAAAARVLRHLWDETL
jgi:sugar phosphate isomerase/epimerase